MSISLTIIALLAGIAVIIATLFLGSATINNRIAEAIGLLGVALIGAAVALYVGDTSDENARKLADNANENTRTVGINGILAQVERVVDTHQAARPCSRYIINADLMSNFVKNVVPASLPETEDRTLCLATFLGSSQKVDDETMKSAEWLYLREQVLSVLNVLELAADYSTTDHPLSHDEAQHIDHTLDGQKMLARYMDGMTARETKAVMVGSMKYIKEEYGTDDPKKFWRVCAIVNCDEPHPK